MMLLMSMRVRKGSAQVIDNVGTLNEKHEKKNAVERNKL